jgi:hypothetical protein
MRRVYLKRPVTLTLRREQIALPLTPCPNPFYSNPFFKKVPRTLKRVRQKLSLALVELDTSPNKEVTVILTELESGALHSPPRIFTAPISAR